MSEKTKFAAPASKTKPKRPSTVTVSSTSSRRASTSAAKEKNVIPRSKLNKNIATINEADVTINNINKQDGSMPDFDAEYRKIAYNKFLRGMLEECLVDEKIEREETQIDIQMAQLADRFQKTMAQLDKTNRRMKDISFVVEQKRLFDLKNHDTASIFEMTDKSNAQEILQDLRSTEQACLDKLETKNIDFGYNKDSGHKQLLDAVNDAIEGLEQIKKQSNLDITKFQEYEKSQKNIEALEKDHFDLETLKAEFETRFPKISEKLLREASEKIANIIEDDIDNDDDDSDDSDDD